MNSMPVKPSPPGKIGRGSPKKSPLPFLASFVLLFLLWVVLSGRFDAFHIILGLISCALVAHFSSDLLFSPEDFQGMPRKAVGFLAYLPWLLYQIFLANLHLLRLSFHPRMKYLIDPYIVRFRTRLRGDMARITFANSITLTPGTITISISLDGDFKVHAIDRKCGEALPGEMEERIARAFGQMAVEGAALNRNGKR